MRFSLLTIYYRRHKLLCWQVYVRESDKCKGVHAKIKFLNAKICTIKHPLYGKSKLQILLVTNQSRSTVKFAQAGAINKCFDPQQVAEGAPAKCRRQLAVKSHVSSGYFIPKITHAHSSPRYHTEIFHSRTSEIMT